MQGIVKSHRGNTTGLKYTPEIDCNFYLDLDPGQEIESKTWLYKLYQSGQWLDSTHMIVIMFYLRMKAASLKWPQKFSTADTVFPSHLNTLFDAYTKGATQPEKSAHHGFFNDTVDDELRGLTNYLPILLSFKQSTSNPSLPFAGTPFDIEMVRGVPQQLTGGDCGVFVLKLAELLQMGISITSLVPAKIPDYRAKWAHDLYVFGSERGRCKDV